jgi:hypothetical protein
MGVGASGASFGAARAPYYPLVSANSANGYSRTLFPLPGGLAQFKFWQAEPLVQMTYTLLRLFVDAHHQRALGRIQIEPGDIGQLEVELGVAAEL